MELPKPNQSEIWSDDEHYGSDDEGDEYNCLPYDNRKIVEDTSVHPFSGIGLV